MANPNIMGVSAIRGKTTYDVYSFTKPGLASITFTQTVLNVNTLIVGGGGGGGSVIGGGGE